MNQLDLSRNEDRIFGKMLKAQADQAGDTRFLVTDNLTVTFAQAEDITNRLATGLAKRGIGEGDRVALYIGNRPEMVLLALAVNKLGAVWSPINTDYKGEWLLDTLNRCRSKLIVTDTEFAPRIVDIKERIETTSYAVIGDSAIIDGAVSYAQLLANEPLTPDYSKASYGDTCAILWTSGTTGKSKGVMQSYNAWVRPIINGASKQYQSEPGDIIYCVLPLFNSGAWITSIFRSLIEGIPCVIEEKFSVSHFWERIEHFGATQTFAIGAMGVFLLNRPETPDDAKTPLKKCSIVPLPPHLWETFEQRFGVKLIRTGLGMSECMLIATQTEDRPDVPVYALGFVPDDIEVGLFDDQGNPVADGEPGEICIKPLADYTIFNGYFDNEEATKAAFRGPWFLTGDMAKRDPKTGAYFFVDRKKDAVRFAGRNISTLEVESVLRRHPAVQDVAAFGIPSSEVESEDELKINVVLKGGANPSYEDLAEFLNDNAPHYFVPRYMEFVDSLPYTPTNKVQKFKLREQGVSPTSWDLKHANYRVKR